MRSWAERQGLGTVLAHDPGHPAPFGLPYRSVPDREVARLLAEAEGLVGSGAGVTWDGERGVLTVVSRPTGTRATAEIGSLPDLGDALAAARAAGVAALEATVTSTARSTGAPPAAPPAAERQDPCLAPRLAVRPVDVAGGEALDVDLVLVGRGVVRAGAVPALQAFADRVGIGVLNTYTAKGVFRWDSPYHFGTGCLQELDLALAGVTGDATVLAVGVDADECVPALLHAAGIESAAGFRGIAPADLGAVDARSTATGPLEPPQLYHALFAIAQPLYALTGSPLNPARAAADLAEVLPDGSAVCVEPGMAALWVGRTLPTRQLGSARVPAGGRPGTAVAAALLGALDGRPRVALVQDDLGPADAALLDWARSEQLDVTVVVWTADAPARDAEQHREALAAAIAAPGVTVLPVAVDLAATADLEAAAGRLVAW